MREHHPHHREHGAGQDGFEKRPGRERGGRGPRVFAPGDLKLLLLALIAEQPCHGYDLAKERSWQVRHDLDFAVLGVPGLTMMNRYISGDNIHTGSITDGKEWGRESELAYTVQAGTFKDLNVRWRNASIRRDYSTHEFDENRIFISYPLSLL